PSDGWWRSDVSSCLALLEVLRMHDHRHELGFGTDAAVHPRLAGKPPDLAPAAVEGDVELELVARPDRLAEAGLVDPHEVDEEIVIVADVKTPHDEDGRSLGQRLDDEDAGHDGVFGEMTLEELLIGGDVLDADGRVPAA